MADTIEKIYCTDGRDNDLAAILAATWRTLSNGKNI